MFVAREDIRDTSGAVIIPEGTQGMFQRERDDLSVGGDTILIYTRPEHLLNPIELEVDALFPKVLSIEKSFHSIRVAIRKDGQREGKEVKRKANLNLPVLE